MDLCRVRAPRRPDVRFGLLDPGEYAVTVRGGMLGVERTVVVTADRTRALVLKLEPGA